MTVDQSIAVAVPADTVRDGAMAPVLRTEGLTVRFGGLTALDSVDFEIRRGEIRAIIGPNGAGKSTFFNCLTGVLRPTGGRILFNGENIAGLPSNLISQKGIARSYQITNILPNATTLENVRIAAQSRRHAWSMLRHHSAYLDIIDKAEAVLEAVGLRLRSVSSTRPTSSPPTSPTASSAISRSASRSPPSPSCSASMSQRRA